LGAKEVLGVDMDGVAVDIARENVRINGVSDIVKIRKGRIGDVRGRFDVVVANIDLRSLRRMRGAFSKHLRNRGYLILSGILEKEKETFIQTYLEAGWFRFVNVIQEEEWVCFTFKKIH
jgi:ribosomal protein L11 methyltransferase